MISFDYYKTLFDRIYVTEDVTELPAVKRVLSRLPDVPSIRVAPKAELPEEHSNSRTLYITGSRGEALAPCPGSAGHLCCNYLTIDAYLGCTLGCSYCIMKWYLNFSPVTVYADTAGVIEKLRRIAAANPDVMVRVGTGEVGDSLELDPLFELSREYIEGVAELPNIWLELKTKTDFVDHLLMLPGKGNTVISFSLNPQSVINSEEERAVSLERRLAAAERALASGYNLAFHFDPIIRYPGWENEYRETVECLSRFPQEKVVWISLGTVRYTPPLKEKIGHRPYLYDEFVLSRDGKYRYLQPLRREIYCRMKEWLDKAGPFPVYMCMESPAMWRRVFGGLPGKLPEVLPIFTRPLL